MMTAEENLESIELQNSSRIAEEDLQNSSRNAEESPKTTELEASAPTVRIDLVAEDTKEEEVSHNFEILNQKIILPFSGRFVSKTN